MDLGYLNTLSLLIRVTSLNICHAMSLDPKVDRTLPGKVRYRVALTILVVQQLAVLGKGRPHGLVDRHTLSEILSFKGVLIETLILNSLMMARVLIKGVLWYLIIKRRLISLSRLCFYQQ
jgi:hypothetical protein